MSRPSAYPHPASLTPANRWRLDPSGPLPRSPRTGIPTIAIALAAIGLLLHGAQGVATVAPVVDLDAAIVARMLVLWVPTVALISLGLATAARSVLVTAIMTVVTLVVTILVVVLASAGTIAWWETLAIAPLLLGIAGGALSWTSLAAGRSPLASVGSLVVLGAVVAHAVLVVAGPIASSAIAAIGAHLLNALPVQVLGIAAIVAVGRARAARGSAIGAGVALALLAVGLLVGPVLAAAATVEPNLGVLAVAVVRFLLVATAGLIVIRSAGRR